MTSNYFQLIQITDSADTSNIGERNSIQDTVNDN